LGGADTIVVGTGGNTITAGAGIDTITLAAGATASTIKISAAAANGADRDVVTGFNAGSGGDVFNFNSGVGVLTGTDGFLTAASLETVSTAGALTVAAATEVLRITSGTIANVSDAASLDGTNVLAALGGALTGAIVGANRILIEVGVTGGGTAVYYASSADNAIIASEITLVGVLNGVGVSTTTFGNFANAA